MVLQPTKLSPRFDDLLEELLLASVAYYRIPRTPDSVVKLAHARWYLEAVRSDIAEERELLTRHRGSDHATELLSAGQRRP